MRIIGGVLKGKKIIEAFDKNTRPLKDLVKESIFNILEHSKNEKISLNNSVILDLFRYALSECCFPASPFAASVRARSGFVVSGDV